MLVEMPDTEVARWPDRGRGAGIGMHAQRCGIHQTVHPVKNIGQGPVSYTHLRAHETVLDLVCRLLLEKKK